MCRRDFSDAVYVLYRCVLCECWTRSQNAPVECSPLQSGAGYLIDSHQTDLGRWQSAKVGGKRKVKKKPRTAPVPPASTAVEYHHHGHLRTYILLLLLHTGSSEDASKSMTCLRRKYRKSILIGTYLRYYNVREKCLMIIIIPIV